MEVGLPLLLGAVVGGLLRGRSRREGWCLYAAAFAVVPAAFVVGLLIDGIAVGVWDLSLIGFLFAFALILFLRSPNNRLAIAQTLLVISSVGFSLLLLEAIATSVLEKRPLPPSQVMGLASLDPDRFDPVCSAAYPRGPTPADRLIIDERESSRLTVHLGDSMVFGTGAGGPPNAFPAWLERMDGTGRHMNAGFRGSSTDGQWLALRAILENTIPERVVHYVFLGNDIHELGRPSVCCGMQPLVVWQGEKPSPRCQSAKWMVPARVKLEVSPAPYALRIFAARSVAAAELVLGFGRLGAWLARSGIAGPPYGTPSGKVEQNLRDFARLMRVIRNEVESLGAQYLVVLMVGRQTVAAIHGREPAAMDMWNGEGETAHRRVAAALAEGRIAFVDAFDFFMALVGDPDEDRWFARNSPGDFHLSAEGHERFARWLEPKLQID